MAVHLILGGVVFVAAFVMLVGLVITIAAAARSIGQESSSQSLRRRTQVKSSELFSEKKGLHAGQCYWECMNGFHWDADWEKQCSAACGLT